jgi:hypothetical protein
MAVAKIYPEAPRGRGKVDPAMPIKGEATSPFSYRLVQQARAVLQYAPHLASAVLSGGMSLDAAYKEAHDTKLASESEEARFTLLREQAPDLADLVAEERMSLSEAWAAWEKRAKDQGAFLAL